MLSVRPCTMQENPVQRAKLIVFPEYSANGEKRTLFRVFAFTLFGLMSTFFTFLYIFHH